MGRLILLLGIVISSCIGCMPCRRDTTLFQPTGRQKAIVTVLPVIDHTSDTNVTWDLSREFTEEIRKRVYDSTRVYLLREGEGAEMAERLSNPDPTVISSDIARYLGAAEFAIVIEIINQTEEPYGLTHASTSPLTEIGSTLSVALRVRVIDVRKDKPKVILQEILNQDYVVTRPYFNTDYTRTPWGTEAFQRTPMGLLHNQLIHKLVARVESYIEAAR